jgi:hypothetical protein
MNKEEKREYHKNYNKRRCEEDPEYRKRKYATSRNRLAAIKAEVLRMRAEREANRR